MVLCFLDYSVGLDLDCRLELFHISVLYMYELLDFVSGFVPVLGFVIVILGLGVFYSKW